MRPTPKTLLKNANLPAFLVTDLTNIRYLTGMSVSSGLVLALSNAFHLFVDSRYSEMASAKAYKEVNVLDITEFPRLLSKYPVCGYESENMTISRLRRIKMKNKNTKFVQTSDVVEEFRRSKEEDELRLIRRAQKITVEILRRIPSALRKGISETDLVWKIEQWAHELSAEGMAFPSIVAFGTNTSRPHHQPTSRALKKGDIVQIDIGAKYKGYCSDRSAVFFTGSVKPEYEKAYAAVMEAKEKAKSAAKKGASTQKLDEIARTILKKYGMDSAFTHSLGHGVGLDIHEGVILSHRAPDKRLLKGEVVTIEPGVYFPGKFGIRLEDMVIVE